MKFCDMKLLCTSTSYPILTSLMLHNVSNSYRAGSLSVKFIVVQ